MITKKEWRGTVHASRRSSLIVHRIFVDGRRTSVKLEPIAWEALQGIAAEQETTMNDLVSAINRNRDASSTLTSAIRAYIVSYLWTEHRLMRGAH